LPKWVLLAAFGVAPAVCATTPRSNPENYPAHAQAGNAAVAAEFDGRSASSGKTSDFTGFYVVVEVAIYPAKGQTVTINPAEFMLHVNGARLGLLPQASSVVAASVKYYAAQEKGFSIDAGLGPLHLPGRPPPVSDIPGDPSSVPPPRPNLPDSESDPNGTGAVPRDVPRTLADRLAAWQLDDETAASPRSGYLYFYWPEKIKKIRTLDLSWGATTGASPKAVLRLLSRKP
jgi:hypothetical protein